MERGFVKIVLRLSVIATATLVVSCGGSIDSSHSTAVPDSILQVMQKPAYKGATWSLQVVDQGTGNVIYDLNSSSQVYIASVRKVFTTGNALNAIGAQHRAVTPVYKAGTVDGAGTLNGNLILVASGDLTMGGRANPDGTIALTSFDHNEANGLGNAVLSAPDPLAGYKSLAQQVAAAGITKVNGDIVIDDRLFAAFDFRDEFMATPIFVNDDQVDVSFTQSTEGQPLPFDYRPRSGAVTVQSTLSTGSASSAASIDLDPDEQQKFLTCIGTTPCVGSVSGSVPVGYVPAPVNTFPLVRTFRITAPSSYARTVFIEALTRAGVTVTAVPVGVNAAASLPAKGSYSNAQLVAQLTAAPYAQDIRFVNKVSYNLGADTTLLMWGLAKNNSTTMDAALAAEQTELQSTFAISPSQYHFVDGSGGGETTANAKAVISMMRGMVSKPDFAAYEDSMPSLGVDGSLTTVTAFESDPTLAGAKGQVQAKTGTYVVENPAVPGTGLLRGQALAGYITAKSGRRLVFFMTVNNVPVPGGIADVVPVFNDEGTIAATLWKLQ
jgi:D-alanyl-D-alanine carboxypeptidase/D-alanyl-D-alanine-endopeptidase (penicillin-binding protein 4)